DPEPPRAPAAKPEAPPEAAGEPAMLPWVIEVVMGIVTPGVVSDPVTIVVHVRGVGMALVIADRGMGAAVPSRIAVEPFRSSMRRGGTMRRHKASAGVSASPTRMA